MRVHPFLGAIGAIGLAVPGAVAKGVWPFIGGTVTDYATASGPHGILKGAPKLGGAMIRRAEGLARWSTGGQPLLYTEMRRGRDVTVFNPRLRNLSIGAIGLGVAARTASMIRQMSQGSYRTDYAGMEQRRYDDLGATGGMALALRNQDSRYALRAALINVM